MGVKVQIMVLNTLKIYEVKNKHTGNSVVLH